MNPTNTLDENLDKFKKLANGFNQSGEKLGAESEAAILINFLHDAYREVKSALKYGRDTISVDFVITTLKCKELELKAETKTNGGVDSLFSKGKNTFRRNKFTQG